MSHEIRTPINAVLGMNELIINESKENNIREYARDVDSSGRILLSLINDILDFSKIESGKIEIIGDQYDMLELLDRMSILVGPKAKDKKLNLSFDIACDTPRYYCGDEARIQQIITNLLTNAIKYTETGSVSLEMRLEKTDDYKGQLIIIVSDTGIGIKQKNLDSLFSSFERFDEKKNRNIEGTGLGLAITKRLIELMGGTIKVTSVYGEGSTFTATIPQTYVGDNCIGSYDIDNRRYNSEEHNNNSIKLNNVKILVADDVAMNLKVFIGFLKESGAIIDAVDDGAKALERWSCESYDIVFLDHMMPGMDGIECAEKMWNNRTYNADTPIVMLTANAIIGMKEKYLEQGFSDYLTKPFTGKQLIDILMKHLPEDKYIETLANDNSIVADSKKVISDEVSSDIEGSQPLIDKATGMNYCCMDESFYNELLNDFLKDNKMEEISGLYLAKDWDNYRIRIHGLKSTSLTIGAVGLSERAKQLEMAVKSQDIQYVEKHHEEVIALYKRVLEKITEDMQ